MTGNLFTCEHCGGTFLTAWSDEDAMADALAKRTVEPGDPEEDLAVICSDCHARFMAWFETLTEEDRARIRAESGES
jgi:5-methylcytosine-specific restriction endonuclease McrA